jgi:hypothetical protein
MSSALGAIGFLDSDVACIWAVIEVETASITQGFGFLLDRRPQILFERHKFREFTKGVFNSIAPDISGPVGGYGVSQYPRIDKALRLCQQRRLGIEPALKSASWGIGQVMGFNHNLAGYPSAAAMVKDMIESEDNQLFAMTMFLQNSGLAAHLIKRDWTKFAVGYNGKDQATHKYDYRLETQYRRFISGSLPNLQVRAAQAALLILGYSPGRIDGVLGQRSQNAIANYRIASGLPVGNTLDGAVYDKLSRDVGWA